jgi:tryptophanyl-tRNA synthetase
MSKSIGNTILLSDSPDAIMKKTKTAVTDPQKIRKGDPGHPDICLVFSYHTKFNPEEIESIRADCQTGKLGCVDCKIRCSQRIIEALEPHREKRAYFESHIDEVHSILDDGERRAKQKAAETMNEVHEAMHMG